MPRVRRSERAQHLVDSHGPDFLEVLARGLRVLAAFRPGPAPRGHRGMTLSEVAAAVDLPRASVRRALYTLEKLGFAASDGRLYVLTPGVLSLATTYLASNGISAVAQPVVERVRDETEETCSVAVLDGDEVVFVARASPQRIVSVDLAIGYRLPAFATSTGRVLLAGLGDEALDAYLARLAPPRLTAHTLTDKARLRAVVAAAREQGWCIVDQEAELGLRSIAVPVRRYDGAVTCAIHVGARVERVGLGRLRDEFLGRLQAAAAQIGPLLT